jgi:hypothetical protein
MRRRNLRLRLTTAIVLAISIAHLAACTPATPLGITVAGNANTKEETYRGVVNGYWQYDPKRNADRLRSTWGKADEAQVAAFTNRYLVRMGIDRSYILGRFAGLVVLPDGWTYSLADVIDDGHTINLGDVVDTRTIIGTNLVEVTAIVRKCNAPAIPGENKDWSIGCLQVDGFDSFGYAGKRYYLSIF